MGVLTQLIVNGLLAGAIYALIASGFSLLFNIQKFVDISYGALYLTATFLTYFFYTKLNFQFFLSILSAITVSALLGILFYKLIFDRLRKHKENKTSLLLASFGLFTLIEGTILLIFGASPKSYGFSAQKGISILGASITATQIIIITASIIILIMLYLLLKKTKLGISLRAISDNKTIASTLGINFNRVSYISIIIASVLASIAGILFGLDQGIFHTMGLRAILVAFTASVVGGMGNIPAAMLGAFLVGLIENLGILYLPSEFKNAIAFIVLIIFLLLKPNGLCGIKIREEMAG